MAQTKPGARTESESSHIDCARNGRIGESANHIVHYGGSLDPKQEGWVDFINFDDSAADND